MSPVGILRYHVSKTYQDLDSALRGHLYHARNFQLALKFWWQRFTRGWDDGEIWNLTDTIVEFVYPRIVAFRSLELTGIPSDFKEIEEWEEVLLKIETAFLILKGCHDPTSPEDRARVDEGIQLFGKYFLYLWD